MVDKSEPAKLGGKAPVPTIKEKRPKGVGGHRSEVKDAHDRYANTDTSF